MLPIERLKNINLKNAAVGVAATAAGLASLVYLMHDEGSWPHIVTQTPKDTEFHGSETIENTKDSSFMDRGETAFLMLAGVSLTVIGGMKLVSSLPEEAHRSQSE